MPTPIVYLDTNHVSRLVRYPEDPASRSVQDLFDSGEAFLGLSIYGVLEVADRRFRDAPEVGAYLDQPFVRWAKSFTDIFSDEIRLAVSRFLGVSRIEPVFFRSIAAAFGQPGLDRPPSVFVQTLLENPSMGAGKDREASRGALLDGLKENAAVYRNPIEPLAAMIKDRGLSETPAGLALPRPLDPYDVIESVGGLGGFPAYEVWNALHRDRLGDATFRPGPNDIVDEIHAAYAPYSTVIALDRRTLGRLRNTQLECADRATMNLEDIPKLVAAKPQTV